MSASPVSFQVSAYITLPSFQIDIHNNFKETSQAFFKQAVTVINAHGVIVSVQTA